MKKRMFTDDITASGKFLRMSEGAQLLYFHMGQNADDDGVVDAFTIMRMISAKEDDLVLLVEREFVVMLEPKELVVWISGWQDFNKIDPRIKEDSKYLPLLLAKVEGLEIVKSTRQEANRRRYQRLKVERELKKTNDPHGITPGSSVESTDDLVRSHTTSIVKDSIGKVSKDNKTTSKEVVPSTSNGTDLWMKKFEQCLGFKITKEPKKNENAIKAIISDHGKEKLHLALEYLHWLKSEKKSKERPYWFQFTTSFLKIRDQWDNIQAALTDDAYQQQKAHYGDDLFNR